MKPIVPSNVIHDDFAANLTLCEDASSDRLVELLSFVQSLDEGLVGIGVDIRYVDATGQGGYGTPYIDCDCSTDSRFVMVYGHHMSDGSQFADFASFINESFAREHSKIIVYKRNGEALELEACAVDIVNASQESLIIDQKADFCSLTEGSDLALRVPSEDRQLFAFTTCSYQTWNSRTTVYAQ